MSREEQLSWEQRTGRPVAIAAFAAGLLLLASTFYSSAALPERETNSIVDSLRLVHENRGDVLLAAVLQGLGTALLAAPLWFLYRAAKFRRPETPPVALYLGVAGPILAAIFQVAYRVVYLGIASDVYTKSTSEPIAGSLADYARDRSAEGAPLIISSLLVAAGLSVAFALIMAALNSMRAGLLSRLMGILGIVAGVAQVLFPLPILPFWLGALGMLFLGRWPGGGRGPAWETGEADPWPSAQDRQAALVAARTEHDEPDEEPAADHNGGQPEHAAHPRSKKRKRKRR